MKSYDDDLPNITKKDIEVIFQNTMRTITDTGKLKTWLLFNVGISLLNALLLIVLVIKLV